MQKRQHSLSSLKREDGVGEVCTALSRTLPGYVESQSSSFLQVRVDFSLVLADFCCTFLY